MKICSSGTRCCTTELCIKLGRTSHYLQDWQHICKLGGHTCHLEFQTYQILWLASGVLILFLLLSCLFGKQVFILVHTSENVSSKILFDIIPAHMQEFNMYMIILQILVLPIWIRCGSTNEDGIHMMLMLHTFYWIFVEILYHSQQGS